MLKLTSGAELYDGIQVSDTRICPHCRKIFSISRNTDFYKKQNLEVLKLNGFNIILPTNIKALESAPTTYYCSRCHNLTCCNTGCRE